MNRTPGVCLVTHLGKIKDVIIRLPVNSAIKIRLIVGYEKRRRNTAKIGRVVRGRGVSRSGGITLQSRNYRSSRYVRRKNICAVIRDRPDRAPSESR